VEFQSYKEVGGTLISDLHTKANLLNDYFCSVFTKEDDGPLPDNAIKELCQRWTVAKDGVINLLDQVKQVVLTIFHQDF